MIFISHKHPYISYKCSHPQANNLNLNQQAVYFYGIAIFMIIKSDVLQERAFNKIRLNDENA